MPATLTKEDEAALSPREIVRAWEDRKFRARLSPERRLRLPAHPAGDARLENSAAGSDHQQRFERH